MKYLGDEYLLLDDIMEIGSPISKVARYSLLGITNLKYLAYESGEKEHLIKQSAFHIGVNKVLQTDPEKYKKIWNGEDERYKQERRIKLTISDMENENYISDDTKHEIYN